MTLKGVTWPLVTKSLMDGDWHGQMPMKARRIRVPNPVKIDAAATRASIQTGQSLVIHHAEDQRNIQLLGAKGLEEWIGCVWTWGQENKKKKATRTLSAKECV